MSNTQTMQNLTFEQIDALLALIEFHDDWDEVSEIVGANVSELHDILTEIRDEVV
jgi:hypothetical protein